MNLEMYIAPNTRTKVLQDLLDEVVSRVKREYKEALKLARTQRITINVRMEVKTDD